MMSFNKKLSVIGRKTWFFSFNYSFVTFFLLFIKFVNVLKIQRNLSVTESHYVQCIVYKDVYEICKMYCCQKNETRIELETWVATWRDIHAFHDLHINV